MKGLMDNLYIGPGDILILSQKNSNNYCRLNTFLTILKSLKERGPYNFSYSSSQGSLINSLTISENIVMDSISKSHFDINNFNLKTYIEQLINIAIIQLFNSITLPDLYPEKSNPEVIKIACLIKTLISTSKYIFLDHPEKYITEKNMTPLISALKYEALNNNRIIIINSSNNCWNSVAKKEIKQEQSNNFKTISYGDQNTSIDNSHLKFINLPSSNSDKKAA